MTDRVRPAGSPVAVSSLVTLAVSMSCPKLTASPVDPLAPVTDDASGFRAGVWTACDATDASRRDSLASWSDAAEPRHVHALPAEVRAIWVVRDALADPEPERIVTYARELGANTLFVQVSGRGDAWYDSAILPRAEQLPPKRADPFARLMAAAVEQGLSVHAWVNVGLIWSGRKPPASPDHVLNRHPEWVACMPDGAPLSAVPQDSLLSWFVEGVFAETAHAGYREHVAAVAREILERYPVDGIHLDYIRRPVIDTGYDAYTVGRFLERTGHVAWEILSASLLGASASVVRTGGAATGGVETFGVDPGDRPHARRDPRHRRSGRPWYTIPGDAAHPARAFRWPDYSDAVVSPAKREWNRYRREAVTLAVARVRTVVDEMTASDGRERILTAAVIPDPERSSKRVAQDWVFWVESGLLDYVVPMCYATGRSRAAEQLGKVLAAVPPSRVIAGAGAYQQPLGACALTLRDMLETDVRGVCIFSWGSLDERREEARTRSLVRRAWTPATSRLQAARHGDEEAVGPSLSPAQIARPMSHDARGELVGGVP